MNQEYKYFAFISYNSRDAKWGKRLQRKLEGYRMPATLCSEHNWKRRPIQPVFFAPTDIQPGGLTEELRDRLKAARHLIVICSPNSAQSKWVGMEIEYFHQLGRTENIHFFIVEGVPHTGNPDTECFNPIVEQLGMPEILGANINEKVFRWPWLNKERAYVQLITKLLGVEFDAIWQRHRRMLIQKIIAWVVGIIAVIATICAVWAANQPVDVALTLHEASVANSNLPPMENAVVTLQLGNETKRDTVQSFEEIATFANVPHSALGKEAHITIACDYWTTKDTVIILEKNINLGIERNPAWHGDVFFTLYHGETPVPNVKVSIEGIEAVSDEHGAVRISVPLAKQKQIYTVTCERELENNQLVMPTTESTVLSVK